METFWALIDTYNETTYDTNTISVLLQDETRKTLRIDETIDLIVGDIYKFTVEPIVFKERDQYLVKSHIHLEDASITLEEQFETLSHYYKTAPVNITEMKEAVEAYLNRIENPVIKEITLTIYQSMARDFYLYPAATKFHHAYIGGVAHHTHTMFKLMDGLLAVYDYLNEDLLIAGIILHDIYKTVELSDYKNPEYTIEGKLIGHITMGTEAILKTAIELGHYEKEERLLLEHMVLSHHYYGNFGSPKKPNLPEALALHHIDNIDSKFAVLGETLEKTETGTFTQGIPVLERERYYKANITKLKK